MVPRPSVLVLIAQLVFLAPIVLGDQRPVDNSRPKVAIVLGGGGAHGVAHLGVLLELERQRIPIDLVVGTGFGGIVGGLYASGMPLQEIQDFLHETDWGKVFDPDSQREDLSFRRKTDDADYLIKYRVGIKNGEAILPTSLVPNEKLAQLLRTNTADVKGIKRFDSLPISFRAVAMDLLTGEEVVLDSGPLDRAMLASASSPGTLPPVQIDDRILVTGSLVNNLPVDVAREWGADVLIVVDVGSYIRTESELSSIFDVVDQVTQMLDQPLNRQVLEKDLRKIYGIGSFSLVDFDLVDQGESSVLQLRVTENRAGNRFWRFGISLEDDLSGNSAYTGSASMTWTQLNRLDAEWRSQVRIGERQIFSTEFYQPLVKTGRYFLSTSAGYTERNVNSYFDGDIIAQSRVKERIAQLQVGRVFGNSGQVTIGVMRGSGKTSVNIGADIPSGNFDIGGYTASAAYDTYDNIYFPKQGAEALLGWVGQRKSAGSSVNVDIVAGRMGSAWSWGAHTLIGGIDIQSQLNKVAGSQNLVTTGGLFQLSGFQLDELSGRHTAVGRAIYYRRMRSNFLRGFLDASFYVGGSLELGNAWQDSDAVSFSNTLTAGSLFLGADTFIGPVYLAAGLAEGGHFATYLYVGRPF